MHLKFFLSVNIQKWTLLSTNVDVDVGAIETLACIERLQTTKNISTSHTLQIDSVFYIDVDQGSLINKKIEK